MGPVLEKKCILKVQAVPVPNRLEVRLQRLKLSGPCFNRLELITTENKH